MWKVPVGPESPKLASAIAERNNSRVANARDGALREYSGRGWSELVAIVFRRDGTTKIRG